MPSDREHHALASDFAVLRPIVLHQETDLSELHAPSTEPFTK